MGASTWDQLCGLCRNEVRTTIDQLLDARICGSVREACRYLSEQTGREITSEALRGLYNRRKPLVRPEPTIDELLERAAKYLSKLQRSLAHRRQVTDVPLLRKVSKSLEQLRTVIAGLEAKQQLADSSSRRVEALAGDDQGCAMQSLNAEAESIHSTTPSIRRPELVVIDKDQCLFTRKEWAQAEAAGRNHQDFASRVPEHCQLEISDKVKMCKGLAKRRATRLRVEADARAS